MELVKRLVYLEEQNRRKDAVIIIDQIERIKTLEVALEDARRAVKRQADTVLQRRPEDPAETAGP